ncbi:MAG: TonB-dependent receptor [Alphaproteobacteria bacterium]|nr:TonB-dependent receptor [Alphaproteobacteria bacterium]
MKKFRRELIATVSVLTVFAFGTGLSHAQPATPPAPQAQPTPPPDDPAAPAADAAPVEKVVVTGSRLRKNEFTSSAPIQIITREDSTLEGLNDTADILQSSSTAAGSQQINNTFSAFVVPGGSGANSISLRGLGANRTLVLVNGRRLAPAGSSGQLGSPDLNTVPQVMIDRFEILKDGSSSIYGSDAVAGAVNVITRQNYEGLSFTADGTATFEGGGNSYRVDGIWGEVFDRGSVTLAGEYYRRETLTIGDRDFLSCAQDNVYEVGSGRFLDIIDPATGQSQCQNVFGNVAARTAGGLFVADPTAVAGGGPLGLDIAGFHRVGISYTRTARVFGAPTFCGPSLCTASQQFAVMTPAQRAQTEAAWRASQAELKQDDARFDKTDVVAPVERGSLYLTGSYDLGSGIEAYTENLFTRRKSDQFGIKQLFPFIDVTHPSNLIGALSQPVILTDATASQEIDFFRTVWGVRGEFGDKIPLFGNWSYDLFVQHSRSDASYTNSFVYDDRVNAATLGVVACDASFITISAPAPSCPTINWFSAAVLQGQFTPQQKAFLFGEETGTTGYTQSMINGSVTGDLFELPYGMVAAAAGFEIRRDEIDDTPGEMARANNYWGQTSAGRTAGKDSVHEVFGEVEIPLLGGMKFAESLTFDASGRYTSYDSYGDGSVFKLGLNYQITPEYRVRGTTGTSFRAPALFEMFLANQTGFQNANAIDPCINWDLSSDPRIVSSCGPGGLNLAPGFLGGTSGTLVVTGGGGPGVLRAETSEARTVGFIWTPDWVDLSIALDYWEFEVKDEVGQLGPANIVLFCHTRAPALANPFCSLYDRDTNPLSPNFGQINTVNDSFFNIASQISDGMDLNVRYAHEFSFGKFVVDGDFTWTFTDETDAIGEGAQAFNGTLYDPDFVGSINTRFERGDWTFFWHTEMASRTSNDEIIGGNQLLFNGSPFLGTYKHFTEFSAVHDASVRYRADDWALVVGVSNIFDDAPPTVSSDGPSTGSFGRQGNAVATGGPYDLLGRRAFISVTKDF